MALEDPDQLDLLKKGKRSKYGNKRVELDGHIFDSIAEAAHYIKLQTYKTKFFVHPSFTFSCGVRYVADFLTYPNPDIGSGRTPIPQMNYDIRIKKDARLWKTYCGFYTVVDVKGTETVVWRIKKKLMLDEFETEIEIVRSDPKTASALVTAYLGAQKRKGMLE